MQIEQLTDPDPADLRDLADVLVDCVADGASVGFARGLGPDRASAWWREAMADSATVTFVARGTDRRLHGCVRVSPAGQENGRHRAEVAKLLVHRRRRGRGYAAALMAALEAEARRLDRTLLVLDTQTGSTAEGLYRHWGWSTVGVVPGYATTPDGDLAPTTVMVKTLAVPTPG